MRTYNRGAFRAEDVNGRPIAGAHVTLWDAATGGSQITTGIEDLTGTPIAGGLLVCDTWGYAPTFQDTEDRPDIWAIGSDSGEIPGVERVHLDPDDTDTRLDALAASVGQIGGPAGPLDGSGLIPSAQVPGGGGGGGPSLSGTVAAETSYGVSSSAGSAATASRGDHTHGTPAQDAGVLLRQALVPSGRVETRSRLDVGIASTTITSGTLYLVPIWLLNGTVVNSITFVAGATNSLSGGTHQWFGLYDSSRVQLAVTSDDTSTAWAAQQAKTLNVATVASGSASSFTTTYTGLHYLGLMVAASTTMVNITGSGASNPTIENATPAFGGTNTGQTSPPAFPFTAATPTIAGPLAYAYVS